MAAEWHYSKGGQQHGPVSAADLKALAQSGQLAPTDMVWKEGMKGWANAQSLKGLFPAPAASKPVPPPLTTLAENQPFNLPEDGPIPLVTSRRSNDSNDGNQSLWNRVWADKLVFLLVCLPICFVLTFILPGSSSFGLQDFFGVTTTGMFVAVIVLAFLRFKHTFAYMNLSGKWHPVDGRGETLEFSGLNTVTRGDSLAGKFTIHKDKSIEIVSGGRVVEVWKLVKVDPSELVIHDASGAIKRFKKKGFFSSDRSYLLTKKWEPVEGDGPAIQFTDDGAMIRFDGFAARYTFSGEEPNEIITIHVNDGQKIELKVLSLGRDEMVLTGDGGSIHYRRGVSISAAEARKRADAFNEKMKTVGKAALATVGVVGAGIAILGVAAAAGAGGSRGVGGGGGHNSGLVRCTACGGQGVTRHTQNMGTNMVEFRCSVCDGKGWVKE